MMPLLSSRPLAAFTLMLLSALLQAQATPARYFSYKTDEVTKEQLLRDIHQGDQLDLEDLTLNGEAGSQRMELERFELFAANAEVWVHDGSKISRKPPRKGAYYHGRLSGQPDSLAVLSVDDTGKTQGIVQLRDRLWLLNDDQTGRKQRLHLSSRALPDAQTLRNPSEPMHCGLDSLKQSANMQSMSPRVRSVATEPLFAALPTGELYQATIAIESDGEFYALFGNADAATQYIANLFAFATTLYERETQTRLTLGQINLWPNAATDPWSFTSTSTGLTAFRNYWLSNKQGVSRTTAHFLSGKNLGGGIAYLGVLCNNNYGYGLSASMQGNFSINNPQPLWDIIVVTHEIGHNFDSEHTHDYQGIGGDANPVDSCMLGGPNGPYSTGYLPGLSSLSGGTPGGGNGTIMSYCHLLSGSYNNITLTFGYSPFAYGIKPYRVSDVMSSFSAQTAQSYPSCLPIITSSYSLSVSKTGAGAGTVTSNPAGISCGSSCTASFNTGSVVTLTAAAVSGSSFGGWSGCGSTSGANCNVTMNAAQAVTATFHLLNTFQLSVGKTGEGTVSSTPSGINCGTTCSANFSSGSNVSLTATPVSGSSFSSWNGCTSTSGTTCDVTMTSAKSVIANFSVNPIREGIAGVSATNQIWYTRDLVTWARATGALAQVDAGSFEGLIGTTSMGAVWYTTNLSAWIAYGGTLKQVIAADLNGDGNDDVVGVNFSGDIWYNLGQGWVKIPGTLKQLATGDVNGDGLDDIVGVNPQGTIWYTTNRNTWTRIPGALSQVAVGDISGDGRADVAGVSTNGTVWYTSNLNNWTPISANLTQIDIGDLNGDGLGDIAGLSPSGAIWYTTNRSVWTPVSGQLAQITLGRL